MAPKPPDTKRLVLGRKVSYTRGNILIRCLEGGEGWRETPGMGHPRCALQEAKERNHPAAPSLPKGFLEALAA